MEQFEPGEVVELRQSPSMKGVIVGVSDDGQFIEVRWVVPSVMEGKTTTNRPSQLRKVQESPPLRADP